MIVSVAICTFNGEKYIENQLISVINQTRKPDEIIICDDSSSDHTVGIAERILSNCDIAYRIIRNESNLGYYKNFEKATMSCFGEIVFWCDQDDVWLENKIEKMIKRFEDNSKCVYCFSDAIIVDKDLQICCNSLNTKVGISSGAFLKSTLSYVFPYGCTVAVKRNVALQWMPFTRAHDYIAATNAPLYGEIEYVDEVLMYYRRHEKAVTFKNLSIDGLNGNQKKRLIERIESLKRSVSREKEEYFASAKWVLNDSNELLEQLEKGDTDCEVVSEVLWSRECAQHYINIMYSNKIKSIYLILVSGLS